MPTLVRILRLLAIVIWVGGIIFFAFVLAPVAFHLLPSTHVAGTVVGGTLRILDTIGLVCGGIFSLGTCVLLQRSRPPARGRYQAQLTLAVIMFLATAYLHFGVLPPMETDRIQAGGDIEASPGTNPAHRNFERLHKRSEQIESVVLLCGLGVVILMARESLPPAQ